MESRHLVNPELLDVLDQIPAYDLNDETLPTFRAAEFPSSGCGEDVIVSERYIPGGVDGNDVRTLIITPRKATKPTPVLLHVHGGGYVSGSPEKYIDNTRQYATACNCVVVAPSYRLAPEAQWPAARDDLYATLKWIHSNAEELCIDPDLIAIGGESAGGGHAAALAIHARNMGGPRIIFQLLTYPMLDDREKPDSYTGQFVWTRKHNHYAWSALLGVEAGSDQVPAEAVPARTADLSGLPPTYISSCTLDLFVDENIEYARRLIATGVPTELRVIPGVWHGFNFVAPTAEVSKDFNSDHYRVLRTAFEREMKVNALSGRNCPASLS